MADYIVKDTELTSVANAIRTAGGTNSLLSFPNGFVNAINNISSGGGGDGDLILITEETITTEAVPNQGVNFGEFSYSSFIKANTITVTFNGTEYECSRIDSNDTYYYGGYSTVDPGQPDFSDYPFLIGSENDGGEAYNFLLTENAGTYTVKIERASSTPA